MDTLNVNHNVVGDLIGKTCAYCKLLITSLSNAYAEMSCPRKDLPSVQLTAGHLINLLNVTTYLLNYLNLYLSSFLACQHLLSKHIYSETYAGLLEPHKYFIPHFKYSEKVPISGFQSPIQLKKNCIG